MDDDAERLRRAVAQYEQPLLRYAARLTGDVESARDVVQDTFLRLCKQSRASVDGHLAEWLFTVCRHRALDHHRQESRMQRSVPKLVATSSGQPGGATAGGPPEEPAASPLDSDPFLRSERRDSAARALTLLGALPANQQEVLRLKFQEGLSYKEIAGVTQLTVSHVGVLIHHGLKSLRERMDGIARPSPRALPSPRTLKETP
ncbi:MAG: RNA polymerase sigma factor [Planctomycetota bacterium]